MRFTALALGLFLFSGCVSAQIDHSNYKGWGVITSSSGFLVRHPSDWKFIRSGSDSLFLYKGDLVHGLGLPSLGGMWVNVQKTEDCGKGTDKFVDLGPISGRKGGPSLLEKIVCSGDFLITLGLWNNDPNEKEHKRLLEKIANTLQTY